MSEDEVAATVVPIATSKPSGIHHVLAGPMVSAGEMSVLCTDSDEPSIHFVRRH